MENVSKLIIKGKLRLRQLAGIDPKEIIVPFSTDKIKKLWEDNEPWQIFWKKLIVIIPNTIDLTL